MSPKKVITFKFISIIKFYNSLYNVVIHLIRMFFKFCEKKN